MAQAVFSAQPPDRFIEARDENRVQGDLQKVIVGVAQQTTIKAWIFFADKGFSTISEYNSKLDKARRALTSRALDRRAKSRGIDESVDYGDIAVYGPYISDVLATGAKKREILRWFNAVTVEATATQLGQIAMLPCVSGIKKVAVASYPEDYVKMSSASGLQSLITTTLNYGQSLPQLEQINVPVAHELGFTGQDVLVCMLDTGYRLGHQAFQTAIGSGRLLAQYDFINHDNNTDYDSTQDATNQPNHGTLTWSTLGGQAPGQLFGPAYGADFCLAKTEDVTGEHHIEEDNWAAGAQWADSLGADVISASLGYRYNFTPPDQDYTYQDMNGDSTIATKAADLAVLNGIAVVTAQGNDGILGAGSLIAPADGDSVIACGAVDENGYIAGFSAFGPTYDGRIKPEVCAMGVATTCADPENMTGFFTASGTSLSTPICGGAAAVLLSVHPNWTPVMVREAMMMTSTNKDNPDNAYGWGILDIGRAMFYHPQGDIVIDHEPLLTFTPYSSPQISITARISGGAGVDPASCYVFSRETGSPSFIRTSLTTANDIDFTGSAPMPDTGGFEYYISATDLNGITATFPYGAPAHFFSVRPFARSFVDSFEDGLYYWKSSGTNGGWSITAERSAGGNISITDSPYGDYHNNAVTYLTSNFGLNLAEADSVECRVKARYELQTNVDKVFFEVSANNGTTWQRVGQAITGTTTSFIDIPFNLRPYLGSSNVRFRFRMTTDGSIARSGIYLDDFTLIWHTRVGITENNHNIPGQFGLAQNYPNPFNNRTDISFTIPATSTIELEIYDIAGRKVKSLYSGSIEAGVHKLIWDGDSDSGNEVSSGVYFYRLKSGAKILVKKMTLLK